jgi:RHS repeat-associated protein
LYYLHADHLGSASLATTAGSVEVPGSRTGYYPYGGVRYGGTGLPTDRTFTGQQALPSTGGLMYYGARMYDPAVGRFISADTIVPQPGNPQSLNRYAYVLTNPLRYLDPTGHYNEEEIVKAFGVSTWDEVLAFFQEGRELAGRWGWLEVLRRAQDSYRVYSHYDVGLGGTAIGAPLPPGGEFNRDRNGAIFVGSVGQMEFGQRGDRYVLEEFDRDRFEEYRGPIYSPGRTFYADAEHMYFHPHFVRDSRPLSERPGDARGLSDDVTSIYLDFATLGGVFTGQPILAGGAQFLQLALGFKAGGSGVADWANRRENLGYSLSEGLLGLVGLIPMYGSLANGLSVVGHVTGYDVMCTP